jgi:hypothetical protein
MEENHVKAQELAPEKEASEVEVNGKPQEDAP